MIIQRKSNYIRVSESR